jgi:curli biogenesis system outer membrane secretion channel CsgG
MRITRIVLAALVALAAYPNVVAGQTPVTTANQVAYDQPDYASVTRFELRVDSGAWADVGKPPAAGAANTWQVALPAMTAGPHTITARACNAGGCSAASTGINVLMVVIPQPPANGRVVSP